MGVLVGTPDQVPGIVWKKFLRPFAEDLRPHRANQEREAHRATPTYLR